MLYRAWGIKIGGIVHLTQPTRFLAGAGHLFLAMEPRSELFLRRYSLRAHATGQVESAYELETGNVIVEGL